MPYSINSNVRINWLAVNEFAKIWNSYHGSSDILDTLTKLIPDGEEVFGVYRVINNLEESTYYALIRQNGRILRTNVGKMIILTERFIESAADASVDFADDWERLDTRAEVLNGLYYIDCRV